jgi:hypothetical protein
LSAKFARFPQSLVANSLAFARRMSFISFIVLLAWVVFLRFLPVKAIG